MAFVALVASVLVACSPASESIDEAVAFETAAPKITLFEDTLMRGARLDIERTTLDLARLKFDDRASSVKIEHGVWTLCQKPYFEGRCVTVGPGEHAFLSSLELDDRVSSIRLEASGETQQPGDVTLYESFVFGGRSFQLTSDSTPDLGRAGFDNVTQSIRIRHGNWTFCEDAYFMGKCITLGPGDHSSLFERGMNRRISSVKAGWASPAIDVGTSTSCGTGYCTAAKAGACAIADPAKADRICVAKGFERHTTFTTKPGSWALRQCGANGEDCFVTEDARCSIVFDSVTCTRD
jgi:hypothetical protein